MGPKPLFDDDEVLPQEQSVELHVNEEFAKRFEVRISSPAGAEESRNGCSEPMRTLHVQALMFGQHRHCCCRQPPLPDPALLPRRPALPAVQQEAGGAAPPAGEVP